MIDPSNPLQRTAVLHIHAISNVIEAYLNYKPATEDAAQYNYSLDMDRAMLGKKILKTMNELKAAAKNVIWEELDDPLGEPAEEGQKELMDQCMEIVLTSGYSLFNELRADPNFAPIIEKIEALPDGSTVSIQTDCAYLPWEILYPLNFHSDRNDKTEANFDPARLWGNRFTIEVLHARRNQKYKPPYQEHRNGRAFISLNLNTTIDSSFPGPYKPAGSHKGFYDDHLQGKEMGDYWTTGAEVRDVLLYDTNNPTVIYLYCHGSSDNPYSDDQVEHLQLDSATSVDPGFIDNNRPFHRGPIIVLNSCASGSYSPLSFSNFLSTFKSRRALGLVATSFEMPATFASAFGQRLLAEYLKGVRIGDALAGLRRDLLRKGNPLGMFYTLQCPMHVTAPT